MKCSRCSAPVRPVVAIDIDGTLADYHGHFLVFASKWLGVRYPVGSELYAGGESFKHWFCDTFGVDGTTWGQIKLAYRQGGMKRSMPLYAGAERLMTALRDLDAEVWLTTTRPHDRFDRVDPDTREFLRRHDIEFDALLYSERKMEELAERVEADRVVFVLDDLHEALRRASDLFPHAVLVQRMTKYNADDDPEPGTVGLWDLLDARALAVAAVQDFAVRNAFNDLPTTD